MPSLNVWSRGCTDTGVDSRGSKFLELCRVSHCLLCTGIVGGDEGARSPCRATSRPRATRPDHVIISKAQAFAVRLHQSRVNVKQRGSVHHPIERCITLRVATNTTLCEGNFFIQFHWKHTWRGTFVGSITNDPQMYFQRCEEGLSKGTWVEKLPSLMSRYNRLQKLRVWH